MLVDGEGGEVVGRIARLRQAGIIRQISAIFDTRALGYQSTLVAMRLPPGAGVRLIAIPGTVAGLVRMSPNPGQG